MSDAHDWYKDAIIYEIRLRSFKDGSGDGIGDFRGLIGKLDYIKRLGVTAVWLLPFYPSPLTDDGYDIADYLGVHPDCGTLDEFREFLTEAHRRGLRVITELVLNHTSDQHAWFQRARHAPKGSPERNWYVWSDTTDRYQEVRIVFQDAEPSNWTWDEVAGQYFWHRFYRTQPDLNYDSPDVRRAMLEVVDFWLGMGVDGLRLDAVPYLFEREGTSCDNLPETHDYLRELRAHIDARYPGAMLLAEANLWPEEAVAYFGPKGDECQMAFNFPVMPRLYLALATGDTTPLTWILGRMPPLPPGAQWATFLRNHDELTLEMVTPEERALMHRVYGADPRAKFNLGIRRRLAPLCGGDLHKIELLTSLLLALPGTPVLYYGDEIGMGELLDLPDRYGVRTPMQWTPGIHAGFSEVEPALPVVAEAPFSYTEVNVAAQESDPDSLLGWTRRAIATRQGLAELFGRGTMKVMDTENVHVLAFLREYAFRTVLVVASFAGSPQLVDLALAAYRGRVPADLGSAERWPALDDAPFRVTLGPYAVRWLELTR